MNEKGIIFSMFVEGKKSLKANQKPRNERTGTRLGRDVDLVSQKSHITVNRVTLLESHETFLRFWLLFCAKMM